jgi:hypothetical protein
MTSPVLIYTADQTLRIGLKMHGYNNLRIRKQPRKINIEDFKAHFGTEPMVLAQVWEDIQTTIEEPVVASKSSSGATFTRFLQSINFLMRYPTEKERKGPSRNTIRNWTWFFLQKVGSLRSEKV